MLCQLEEFKALLQVVKLDKLVSSLISCLNVFKPQPVLCLLALTMVLVVLSPDKYCDGTLINAVTPQSFAYYCIIPVSLVIVYDLPVDVILSYNPLVMRCFFFLSFPFLIKGF
jgi:hypothetical protein